MLAIQLKRFDYDWERDCPIKFNDYFEFPREIDMEPYTVYGLAKIEGNGYPFLITYLHMYIGGQHVKVCTECNKNTF